MIELIKSEPSERSGFGTAARRAAGEGVATRFTALVSLALAMSFAFGAMAGWASPAGAASLYVANGSSRTITAFTVGSNGGLSPVAGSPFDVGIAPVGVAISPDAEHLYVTNLESNTISAFSVAPDGGLSSVQGSPFATGAGPWGVAVSPDGGFLYVVNKNADSVSAYSISLNGSLDPVAGSPFPTVGAPGGVSSNGVAVTPDGEHLYVTNMGKGGSVSAYTIALDGSLIPVEGSPFDAGATARPVSVTPNGKYLYVGNATSEDISVYSIGSDGVLTSVADSPFATEGGPLGLAVTPDSMHLYTAHIAWEPNVWGYSIAANGALSTIPGTPFPTKGFRGNSAAVSPDGNHLYTSNSGSDNLSAYSIAGNGALTSITGSPFAAGNGPLQLAVTPDQGPVATFWATPTPAGNPLRFDATASSDSDGNVVSYHWDFGDGRNMVTSTATPTHVYESAGDYTVVLTVTDDAGCSTTQTFTGQTAGCNGSPLAEISHQITVATGEPLSVSTSGSGSGSVTSSPSGVACPGACSFSFEPGTEVTLIASAEPGSAFAGWAGGGCSGTGACQVTVDADTEVIATFSKIPPPAAGALSVRLGGSAPGSVTSAGGEISCPSLCSHVYPAGTQVALVAAPAPGARFTGWSGGGCAAVAGCQLTVGADTTVTASFEASSAVNPHLRIGRVRGNPRPGCKATLRFVSRPLEPDCAKPKITVGGAIAKAARGAVKIKASAYLNGRRIGVAKWARILNGRWRASIPFPWAGRNPNATIFLTARFEGSFGVESGYVERRVRVLPTT